MARSGASPVLPHMAAEPLEVGGLKCLITQRPARGFLVAAHVRSSVQAAVALNEGTRAPARLEGI